jgi:uncharacterized membrane protein
MAVVVVLFVSTLLFRALGALGVEALGSWHDAARWGLSVMLLVTASAHFNRMRRDLVAMVPPSFPKPELAVTATGILELLAAAGIQVPETRRLVGLGLMLLMAAMFPANVSAARRGVTLAGKPVTPLWLRLPMQVLFIGVAWWTTQTAGAAP